MKENTNNDFRKIPKKNPFKVPEGYFDSFSERLHEKIDTSEERPKEKTGSWGSFKTYFSLAAGFLIFVLISYAVLHLTIGLTEDKPAGGAGLSEIIENDIHEYDDDAIIELMVESENLSPGEGFNSGEMLAEEDIMLYLLEEDIDTDLIIEEL